MSGLKLYLDPLSPICRSVMVLMETNGIAYEKVMVSLGKGEAKTNPDLFAINPSRKVPALDDNGFTMFESDAILRYLTQKNKLPDHWYPSDLQARARVDQALSWFNGNLRCGCFFHSAILPKRTQQPRNEAKCAELRTILKNSLEVFETYFLKDRKFIGGDKISIADLQFLGEVTQYWIADCDIYKGRPNMEKWMEECQKVLAPHFESVFSIAFELRKAGTFHAPIDV